MSHIECARLEADQVLCCAANQKYGLIIKSLYKT